MAVHVGEVHTDLSSNGAGGGAAAASSGEQAPTYPGVNEDRWSAAERRVTELRRRVRAEDFDD
ncbi:hypothetical protein [Demequina mangrovi]|uniref:Uncharacterized protein n=1 Tax=Demequina mangrovi TaxID=1043493 RepID=A0A1H6TRW5_9MICO|nr:hypothetical protein [Demequina mangrovi]SEI82771.1 hypothetical protein SAMN05421637_0120 [Demequina mangrovi]